MAITEVIEMLERIKSIHERKNKDYAAQGKDYENFERSAQISSWFINDIDKAFVTLISTKLARLATLLNSDEVANNESIDDSFDDLATYCILWAGKRQRMKLSPSHPVGKEVCPHPSWLAIPNSNYKKCSYCGVVVPYDTLKPMEPHGND